MENLQLQKLTAPANNENPLIETLILEPYQENLNIQNQHGLTNQKKKLSNSYRGVDSSSSYENPNHREVTPTETYMNRVKHKTFSHLELLIICYLI
jgi:hypothetical protein